MDQIASVWSWELFLANSFVLVALSLTFLWDILASWPQADFPIFPWLCAQSSPTLCDPTDCSPPDSSVHGILQARVLERVAISFSTSVVHPITITIEQQPQIPTNFPIGVPKTSWLPFKTGHQGMEEGIEYGSLQSVVMQSVTSWCS